MEFRYDDLRVGTFVQVSRDPADPEGTLGLVLRPKPNAADILMIVGGFRGVIAPLRDCWHRSDPRVQQRPEVFGDGDRGVFVLAPREQLMNDLVARMALLEDLVEQLADKVEERDGVAGVAG